MAGLLSDVLPFIYSRSNALKRNVNSLLDSPIEYLKQGLGQGNDDARVQNGLLAAAVKEKGDGPANQALQNQTNSFVMNSLGPLATVWHGSPHKFTKFDASKIGTGEGAQAYGHGLYLAESPDVAKGYKEKLSDLTVPSSELDGLTGATKKFIHEQLLAGMDNAGILQQSKSAKSQAMRWDSEDISRGLNPSRTEFINAMDDVAKVLSNRTFNSERGSLYKVDLPDEHIAKMLDWDKPLSEQHPDVQKAIAQSKSLLPSNALDDLGGDLSVMYGKDVTPSQWLNTWEDFGVRNGGETALQKAGIPGIRYLDGGSRGTGAGTSNFVVFPGNEGLLTILERNGQPVNGLLP